MKIGLVCPYNMWLGGGVQELVLALKDELKLLGHDVKVITPQPQDTKYKLDKDIIFVGTSRSVKTMFSTTAQVSISRSNDDIDDMLEKEKFDVLHFHEPWVPLMSRQLLSRSNSVNIATFHAKLPESAMSKTIEKVITPYTKSIMKYLNHLTAVSEAAADYVTTITDNQITIVPNGIDLNKYKPAIKTKSKYKNILYVGRLEKRKGVKYLIKAFKEIVKEDKNIKLTVAGDGPDRAMLEAYVSTNKIPNIKFEGYVSNVKKHKLLRNADLFCSPALYGESFGIVLLEAMASGVVTIAGNNAGYTSLLQDRGSMSIVNPKDTIRFVKRIKLMLDDEQVRKLWLEWAFDYVQNFDYHLVAKQYESVYTKALKNK